MTKITFIGAGSTIFMQNIVGDALLTPALANSHFALMDIDPVRLAESEMVVRKMIESTGVGATVSSHTDRRAAMDGADFSSQPFRSGDTNPVP
jgi:alpha-galactosidase